MNEIDLIYIGGYGRSGSTLLDITVSNVGGCASIGAGAHVFQWLADDRKCACGDPVSRCPLWSEVGSCISDAFPNHDMVDLHRIQRRIEGRGGYFRPWSQGGGAGSDREIYRRSQRLIFAQVSRATGAGAVVDSSGTSGQSVGRARALSRIDGVNVKLIMLTRDPRAVVSSALRKPGSPEREESSLPPLLQTAKVALSWGLSNAVSEKVSTNRDVVSCRVRYEDFVTAPANELERMACELGLDFTSVIDRIERESPLQPGHIIAGNRLRFQDAIRIQSDTSYSLGSVHSLLAGTMTLPLRLLYRYH